MPQATNIRKAGGFDYTPSGADIAAGEVVVDGERVGVAIHSIADGEPGFVSQNIVCTLPKATGGGTDFTNGTPLFWNNSSNVLSESSGDGKLIGYANQAATTTDATAQVEIRNPSYDTDT